MTDRTTVELCDLLDQALDLIRSRMTWERRGDLLTTFGQVLEAADRRLCAGCSIDTMEIGEYYMVRDDVWREAMPTGRGYLCIGCLEALLGRDLRPADFTDCPLNHDNHNDGSFRLRRRLSGGGPSVVLTPAARTDGGQ